MELGQMKKQFRPCDMDHPFVFISYSSADRTLVWRDALELQYRGYNIWIDETDLDRKSDSWKTAALAAIENYNCALVIFYASRHSLVSKPCLEEMTHTFAPETLDVHMTPVPYILVDVENVGNIVDFASSLHKAIGDSGLKSDERTSQARCLSSFLRDILVTGNDRVRLHAKSEPGRIGDYYTDLENELKKLPVSTKFSTERNYRNAVACLGACEYDFARQILTAGAQEGYSPAQLLLAHMHHIGYDQPRCDADAQRLWREAQWQTTSDQWAAMGQRMIAEKYYSEALAYLLAAGDFLDSSSCLFEASKLWLRKGCRSHALTLLRRAECLGEPRAPRYRMQLQSLSEAEIRNNVKKYDDETPVK